MDTATPAKNAATPAKTNQKYTTSKSSTTPTATQKSAILNIAPKAANTINNHSALCATSKSPPGYQKPSYQRR